MEDHRITKFIFLIYSELAMSGMNWVFFAMGSCITDVCQYRLMLHQPFWHN